MGGYIGGQGELRFWAPSPLLKKSDFTPQQLDLCS